MKIPVVFSTCHTPNTGVRMARYLMVERNGPMSLCQIQVSFRRGGQQWCSQNWQGNAIKYIHQIYDCDGDGVLDYTCTSAGSTHSSIIPSSWRTTYRWQVNPGNQQTWNSCIYASINDVKYSKHHIINWDRTSPTVGDSVRRRSDDDS
jgi:hypothetical protein